MLMTAETADSSLLSIGFLRIIPIRNRHVWFSQEISSLTIKVIAVASIVTVVSICLLGYVKKTQAESGKKLIGTWRFSFKTKCFYGFS